MEIPEKEKIKNLIKKLAKSKKSLNQQIDLFKRKTNGSRATFFRYRDRLGLKSGRVGRKTKFNYTLKNEDICYFCSSKSDIIHHIDKNRKNNNLSNLLPLCNSCHNKIHRIYNSYFEQINKRDYICSH